MQYQIVGVVVKPVEKSHAAIVATQAALPLDRIQRVEVCVYLRQFIHIGSLQPVIPQRPMSPHVFLQLPLPLFLVATHLGELAFQFAYSLFDFLVFGFHLPVPFFVLLLGLPRQYADSQSDIDAGLPPRFGYSLCRRLR